MAKQPPVSPPVVAEPPAAVDTPAPSLAPLPAAIVQAKQAAVPAPGLAIGKPASSPRHDRIGRVHRIPGPPLSPLAQQAADAATAGQASAPVVIPGFAAGVSADRQAVRDGCAVLGNHLQGLVLQGGGLLVQCVGTLADLKALPNAAEEALREGVDLDKVSTFLNEMKDVFVRFGVSAGS